MKQSPLTPGLVKEAYLRAYWFLQDAQDSLEAVRTAAYRLDTELENQVKRMKLSASKRTVTILDPSNLYLSLSLAAANTIAVRNLRGGSSMLLAPPDCLCLFLLHAIGLGRQHSLPLSVAVTRIIHDYPTDATRLLYEVMLLGNDERGDFGYRGIKSKQMRSLGQVFQGLVREVNVKGQNGEKRFASMPNAPESYRDLAFKALDLMTVWNHDHIISEGFAGWPMKRLEAVFAGEDSVAAHVADQRRMHALSDPLCFGRVVAAANLKPTRENLSLPLFYLPDGTPADAQVAVLDRMPVEVPEERVLREIANIPANQSALREQWIGGPITVWVDGERLQSIDPGVRRALRSPYSSFVSTVEVWGDCGGEDVLLALETFSLIDSGDPDLAIDMVLPNGADLGINVIVRGHADSPVLVFCVAYAADDTDDNEFVGLFEIRSDRAVFVMSMDLKRRSPDEAELPRSRGP